MFKQENEYPRYKCIGCPYCGRATQEKNPAAVALGRLDGLKGGKARAERLTLERRVEIAKKAAMARWGRGA